MFLLVWLGDALALIGAWVLRATAMGKWFAVGAASGAGLELVDYAKRKIVAVLMSHKDELLAEVIKRMGLEIDPAHGLTDEGLTAAVNKNLLAGYGVQIDSLLDRQKLLAGLERTGLEMISAELGIPAVSSRGDIRGALQAWLVSQVGEQLAAQAGGLIDAAKPVERLQNMIEKVREPKPTGIVFDMSPKGIANREAQARYRATHRKYWVQRG